MQTKMYLFDPQYESKVRRNLGCVLRLVLVGEKFTDLELGIKLFKFLPVIVHSEQFMPWK